MTSNEVRENLKAYVDGELSAKDAEAVRAALEIEPSLREEVAALQLLADSLAALRPEVEPGETDVAELARQVSEKRDRWRALLWTLVPALGALLLIMLFGKSTEYEAKSVSQGPAVYAPVAVDESAKADESGLAKKRAPGSAGIDYLSDGRFRRLEPRLGKSGKLVGGQAGEIDPAARSIIRTASLSVVVKEAGNAERTITELVRKHGGVIAASSGSHPSQASQIVSMTLRVPAERLDALLEAIAGVGRVTSRSLNSVDVTDAIADNEVRLRNLRAQEKTYLRLLDRAKTVKDVLAVEAQLGSVRTNIEMLETHLANTNKQVAMSTISLALNQNVVVAESTGSWLSRALADARSGLADAGRSLVVALVFIAVYAPLWGGALVVFWLVRRRLRWW